MFIEELLKLDPLLDVSRFIVILKDEIEIGIFKNIDSETYNYITFFNSSTFSKTCVFDGNKILFNDGTINKIIYAHENINGFEYYNQLIICDEQYDLILTDESKDINNILSNNVIKELRNDIKIKFNKDLNRVSIYKHNINKYDSTKANKEIYYVSMEFKEKK